MVTVNREPRIHVVTSNKADGLARRIRGLQQVGHHLVNSDRSDLLPPATRVLDSLASRYNGSIEEPGSWRLRPFGIRMAADEIRESRTTINVDEQDGLLYYLRDLHDQAQQTFSDFVAHGPDLQAEPLQAVSPELLDRYSKNPRAKYVYTGKYRRNIYGDRDFPNIVVVQPVDAQPVTVRTNHHRRRYVLSGGDPVESIQVFDGTPVSLVGVRGHHLYLNDSEGFSVEASRFGDVFVDENSRGSFRSGEAGEIRIRSASTLALENVSAQQIHVRDNAVLTTLDVETDILTAVSKGEIGFYGDAYKTRADDSAEIVVWGDPGAQFINGKQLTERVRPSVQLV